jgi:hypothetical protein
VSKRQRHKFKTDILATLQSRAQGKCECCGLDIPIDKHHIWEFAKGGPDVASNILCLCPSCHRVLPPLLTREDQKFIQTLNFQKSSGSFSFYANESEFEIGTVLYKSFRYILTLDGKPAIYPYQVNGRFYVNIVMLEHFDPYLLVIANRVIYNAENFTSASDADTIKIVGGNTSLLEMERSDGRIKAALNFKYRGEPFVFNDKGSLLPGNTQLAHFAVVGNHIGGAISWDFKTQ